MACTVDYDDATGVIRVLLTGAVTGAELREASEAALTLGSQRGTEKFLVDCRAMLFRASTLDLFYIPEKQYEGRMDRRRARFAVVAPTTPDELEAARFYETVCLNRDWQARVFHQLADAIAWLNEAASRAR
jgi:hypothetical protein